MKKISLFAGLGASLALCMVVACTNKSSSSPTQKAANPEIMDKAPAEPAEPEVMNPVNAANGGEACQKNDDCALIPTQGCYGCMAAGGSHKAVSKTTQQAFIQANMQKCMAEFQKQAPKPNSSQDPNCQFDGAGCNNGVCALRTLSQEEKTAQQQRMQQAMRQNGQGGQGQGPGQGQGQGQGMDQGQGQGQPQ